jgi:putative transcriptional regulator
VSRRETAAVPEEDVAHRITCRLDELLAARGMTLTDLAQRVGVSVVNLSILKNDRARAIRFSTLTAICDALDCTPGDVLDLAPLPARPSGSGRGRSA